jgi:hypothetical protein
LGVTPSAWNAYRAFQFGQQGVIFGDAGGGTSALGSNQYWNGSNWIRIATDAASQYKQAAGSHAWYNAPSGTAGTSIAFTQAMTLDSLGNIGLGVTPSAWGGNYKAIQIGSQGSLHTYVGVSMAMAANAYDSGAGAWKYIANNYACRFVQDPSSGVTVWQTAGSGTAGNALTWTSAMTLDVSGNLGLGVTTSAWLGTMAALQMKNGAAFYGQPSGTSGDAGMSANQYVNTSGSRIYIANGYATFYDQKGDTGAHRWFVAPSGTAGSNISFTQAMTLFASGGLALGNTNDPSANNIRLANDAKVGFGDGTSWYSGNGSTGFVSFGTNNTERARINSEGQFGIGSTSMNSTLVVNSTGETAIQYRVSGVAKAYVGVTSASGQIIDSSAAGDYCVRSQANILFSTNGQYEKARITSSGNLLVGTTSTNTGCRLDVVGGNITVDGFDNGYGISFRRGYETNDNLKIYARDSGFGRNGALALTAYDGIIFGTGSNSWIERMRISSTGDITFGSTWGYIKQFSSYLAIGSGNVALMYIDDGTPRVIPRGNNNSGSNGLIDLGDAGSRYKALYATNGTIQTSDAREKTAVVALTANEIEAAKQLANEIGTYKWLEAVTSKGFDNARNHVGMTVQRAIEVMEANGLDAMKYGFICYDTWKEERNEKGELIRPAGDSYSFRTDQLSIFISRGQQAIIQQLQADVAALKGAA